MAGCVNNLLSVIVSKDPLVTCQRCGRLVLHSKTEFYPHASTVRAVPDDLRSCSTAHAAECEAAVAKLYPDPVSRFIAVRPR
jgi:hypothetical protein